MVKFFLALVIMAQRDLVPYLEAGQEIQLRKILSDVIFNKPEKHYFDINKKAISKKDS